MAELTFRDFAGAIMRQDPAGAAAVLQSLLALSPEQASAATAHFQQGMTNPAFMPKAMGLRTAVTSGSDAESSGLLADCFGLHGAAASSALAALRIRYPAAG